MCEYTCMHLLQFLIGICISSSSTTVHIVTYKLSTCSNSRNSHTRIPHIKYNATMVLENGNTNFAINCMYIDLQPFYLTGITKNVLQVTGQLRLCIIFSCCLLLVERHEQKEQLQWTMSGLTLPSKPTKKGKSKFLLSKRFKEMVTIHKRRIMVYLNGQYSNCHEVISDLKSMDDVSTTTLTMQLSSISIHLTMQCIGGQV